MTLATSSSTLTESKEPDKNESVRESDFYLSSYGAFQSQPEELNTYTVFSAHSSVYKFLEYILQTIWIQIRLLFFLGAV